MVSEHELYRHAERLGLIRCKLRGSDCVVSWYDVRDAIQLFEEEGLIDKPGDNVWKLSPGMTRATEYDKNGSATGAVAEFFAYEQRTGKTQPKLYK